MGDAEEEGQACRVILRDHGTNRWLVFREPEEIVTTGRMEEVLPLLRHIESRVAAEHLHAAGFLAYEAAPAFDAALSVHPPGEFPLLWFALFRHRHDLEFPGAVDSGDCTLAWSPSITQAAYDEAVATIRRHIHDGSTYQVNFSFRLSSVPPPDPWKVFTRMVQAQGPGLAAFVQTGRWVICSASPELFFRLDGERLLSKPMKGTARRLALPADDRTQPDALRLSAKTRAENLMIADMVRNDMGRIARFGSVDPVAMFEVERYPTLWQMTSTIACRTDASYAEILTALFPPASITGAPKVRTMEIIRDLETTPRRIYTGAIGFLSPGREAQFNVAIRTLLIDTQLGRAEYGTGSGIVWDSEASSEYAECMLKAEIVSRQREDFSLLETLLWTPETGFFLLDRHLHRLTESAAYFGRPSDHGRIAGILEGLAARLPPLPHRVRFLLREDGEPEVQAFVLERPQPYRICLARKPVDPREVFLYHKTTRRSVYDEALADAPGHDDVLLWNDRGEITESTRANVVVDLDGERITPPVSCGLLPGVFRSQLLAEGTVREGIVRKEDLARCANLYLMNSVRMMWKVKLQEV